MEHGSIVIVGAGPAGLMAAEVLAEAGEKVVLCDAMAAPARKLLLAGKSGLNLTKAEPFERFVARYGAAAEVLEPSLDRFGNDDVRAWAEGLGIATFVGSSGRVFPKAMKASPLLRAWLKRLGGLGVELRARHRWVGFDKGAPVFTTPDGQVRVEADAVVLALGGASYPRLGSDAAWVPILEAQDIAIAPLRPANCGFDCAWSAGFAERYAGLPVKSVSAASDAGTSAGEFVVSAGGIEGSLVYEHSAALRDALERDGSAWLFLDLTPGRSREKLAAVLARQPGKASFTNRLRKGARLDGVKAGLLRECVPDANRLDPQALAAVIKALPLRVTAIRPIAEAISSAGGIDLAELDANFMLTKLPGVFAAGEMLDWEAPTGGYLLTGCMTTGRAAAAGILAWRAQKPG